MTVSTVLAAGRSAALALMLDTGTVTRPSGQRVWDPATGSYTDAALTTVYDGPCRLKPWSNGSDVQAGEQQVALRSYWVALPCDAPAVEVGDTFTVTASGDGWLAGRSLHVTAVELATARTARWITVEDQA